MPPRTSHEQLRMLHRWARLLDKAFPIPFTRFSFGWDAILGLVPGIGDLVSPLFSVVLLVHSVRLRIPRIVQLRMILNAAIDALVGTLPIIGDVFDALWMSNAKNLALLERHAGHGVPPSPWDYVFVIMIFGLAFVALALPILLILWALFAISTAGSALL